MNYLFTSESVSEGHPDKVADQISDAILDEFLRQDPDSKVAVETFWIAGQAGFLASVDWRALALGAVIFIFSQCVKKTSKWHPIIYIGISAAVGLLLF